MSNPNDSSNFEMTKEVFNQFNKKLTKKKGNQSFSKCHAKA
jgi:hypothetical protein